MSWTLNKFCDYIVEMGLMPQSDAFSFTLSLSRSSNLFLARDSESERGGETGGEANYTWSWRCNPSKQLNPLWVERDRKRERDRERFTLNLN